MNLYVMWILFFLSQCVCAVERDIYQEIRDGEYRSLPAGITAKIFRNLRENQFDLMSVAKHLTTNKPLLDAFEDSISQSHDRYSVVHDFWQTLFENYPLPMAIVYVFNSMLRIGMDELERKYDQNWDRVNETYRRSIHKNKKLEQSLHRATGKLDACIKSKDKLRYERDQYEKLYKDEVKKPFFKKLFSRKVKLNDLKGSIKHEG